MYLQWIFLILVSQMSLESPLCNQYQQASGTVKLTSQMHIILLIDEYFKFCEEFLFLPCLEMQLVNDPAVSSELLNSWTACVGFLCLLIWLIESVCFVSMSSFYIKTLVKELSKPFSSTLFFLFYCLSRLQENFFVCWNTSWLCS